MEVTKSSPVEPGKWRQFLAAIITNISTFSYGIILGWTSPVIPLLLSPNNPVSKEPLTAEEISWLNSILCITGIPLLPLCSLIAERFGRKLIGYFIAIPFVASWLLTIFGSCFQHLIIARIFASIGGAFLFFLIPLYVTEISGDSIRGLLGTFMVFGINIGIFLAYTLGAVLSYQLFAICALIFPMIFFGCFIFLPETPTYLVRKNRITDAVKSLMWLKNGDKSAVDQELLRLQTLAKESSNPNTSVGICDLFRDRATIKGFIIANALLSGQQMAGITAMLTYTTLIFDMAGSSLSPNTATIIIGGIQIFGSWLSTIFMERAGRRILIQISCLGMLLCHFAIATFLFLQSWSIDVSSFRWIPLVALSVYVITYSAGMGPAPFIVASEVFSPDIAAFACSIAMSIMFAVAFAIVKFFPLAIQFMGMHGCFYLLSMFCGCTLLFTYFFVPETKGRSIESIIDELNGCSGRFNENDYVKASVEINEKNIHTSSV
ncbi:facilitated trehalose transporter Tret1-like [Chelonus insularis]|uniref:facilitated trehalose transporter Tret1-like n=1 Tax=Chelonus insularis TaxID=460826 RepID=UPI00158C499B|nr:facilitated trehalose transporter Tret1-like [Chelonus insularis]